MYPMENIAVKDEARPDDQRWGDGCICGVLLPLHAV
jgi:hypothetical protein